jgi:beta-lactamase superfamily II metal-dependent hydrolase
MKIHFLNVGHGDCTFIELPSGRLMMIDINNSKSLPEADIEALAENKGMSKMTFKSIQLIEGKFRSWEEYYKALLVDPADYYKEHFANRSIFRYVQTHPDMDHMSGLHRFFWQDQIPLENFWDVDHSKSFVKDDFEHSPYSYLDWLVYELLRGGHGPDGKSHEVIKNLRAGRGSYWSEDNIEILSPTQDLINTCNDDGNYNNCSYVLKITHAGRTVILPGDAEAMAWKSILDEPGSAAIKCGILKASHHGRESGYHEDAVDAMSPQVVICSVGKKPSTDASDEYASHGATVLSTRFHSTITATVWDDGDVWIENHKGERLYTIK